MTDATTSAPLFLYRLHVTFIRRKVTSAAPLKTSALLVRSTTQVFGQGGYNYVVYIWNISAESRFDMCLRHGIIGNSRPFRQTTEALCFAQSAIQGQGWLSWLKSKNGRYHLRKDQGVNNRQHSSNGNGHHPRRHNLPDHFSTNAVQASCESYSHHRPH